MKHMPIREFLRGGYRDVDDVTVISNHGRPVFTVFPYGHSESYRPQVVLSTESITTTGRPGPRFVRRDDEPTSTK